MKDLSAMEDRDTLKEEAFRVGLFAPEDRLLILIEETTKHSLCLSAWDTSYYVGSDQKEQGGPGKGRAPEAHKGLEIWVMHMTY